MKLYNEDFVKSIVEKIIKVDNIFYIGSGNHSDAFLINDDLVIKMPKHKKANESLKSEIKILKALENKLNLNIPSVEFSGMFRIDNAEFNFFISKKLRGKKLLKNEFISLSNKILRINAEKIAKFLSELHNQKEVMNINRRDLFLLHGDFSLNHCLFDENNIVCGILDFGDARVGKAKSDFMYLLDEEDAEEIGIDFGQQVLDYYNEISLIYK